MRTGFEKVSQVLGDALIRELHGSRKLDRVLGQPAGRRPTLRGPRAVALPGHDPPAGHRGDRHTDRDPRRDRPRRRRARRNQNRANAAKDARDRLRALNRTSRRRSSIGPLGTHCRRMSDRRLDDWLEAIACAEPTTLADVEGSVEGRSSRSGSTRRAGARACRRCRSATRRWTDLVDWAAKTKQFERVPGRLSRTSSQRSADAAARGDPPFDLRRHGS